MKKLIRSFKILLFFIAICIVTLCIEHIILEEDNSPLIFVVILIRNKEHSLPYFLSYFGDLNYPKNRMFLYIRADHCEDKSIDIIADWLNEYGELYYKTDAVLDHSEKKYRTQKNFAHMTDEVSENIIRLNGNGLQTAKHFKADYTLYIDADVYITYPNILNDLIYLNYTVSAPLLVSTGLQANFELPIANGPKMNNKEYFMDIMYPKKSGCHKVETIRNFIFINMKDQAVERISFRHSKLNVKNSKFIDSYTLAESVTQAGLSPFICNYKEYGYVEYRTSRRDTFLSIQTKFQMLRLDSLRDENYLTTNKFSEKYLPTKKEPTKAGLDQIYYINLERRPNRRKYMERILAEHDLTAKRWEAVDGVTLNLSTLAKEGIKVIDEFADKMDRKTLLLGEIGCFLSHYRIWEDVIKNKYDQVMIFEDDAFPILFFNQKLNRTLNDIKKYNLNWDFIFLDRNKMRNNFEEETVDEIEDLYKASYSVDLTAYLLSLSGAKKLVDTKPLDKIISVDEYVALMFDDNFLYAWTKDHYFPNRTLKAFALDPTIVEKRYSHEDDPISDTSY